MYSRNIPIKILFYVGITLLTSCDSQNKQPNYKSLIIPSSDLNLYKDSIKISTLSDFLSRKNYKSLVFLDIDCSICLANLVALKNFFNKQANIPFIVIIQSKNTKTFQSFCDIKNIKFNILFDPKAELKSINKFHDSSFILLNYDNQIIIDGNPIMNKDIFKLYSKYNKRITHTTN